MKAIFSPATVLVLAVFFSFAAVSHAAEEAAKNAKQTDSRAAFAKSVQQGLKFLAENQLADGSLSKQTGPAVTALAVTAAIRHGRPISDPLVTKGLAYLESNVQSTGGIHSPNSRLVNYETCIAVVAFGAANQDGKYKKIIDNAEKFLRGAQLDEEEGHEKASVSYGGAAYGGGKESRPDLSNTHYLIEALRAAGHKEDSEAVQKALVFVSRCQNLETAHNTTPFAAKINDGGFYYTPAGVGEGKKGPEGGLRSYGSMSYAGLKSMIFAGLKRDDPRVKGAVSWIEAHYDLKSNPGMGTAGLYYYYHLFAKALDALETDRLRDATGKEHDWRAELILELASRQREDGSWINDNDKWMEGDPYLATSFALLALSHCRQAPAAK